mgnify:CR=1 FL=1
MKLVQKSKQSDASKTRATTATNNKTGTVKKMRTVMVEKQVKETATTVVLMIKGRNNKVSKTVAMIVANKRKIVRTKLVHVLISRLVQQP